MVDSYSNRGPITTKADIWALGVLLYKVRLNTLILNLPYIC
jgi:hypothetical protein